MKPMEEMDKKTLEYKQGTKSNLFREFTRIYPTIHIFV